MSASPEFAAELVDVMDDRAARIVETWDAWREEPHSFTRWVAFELVMSEHIADLRAELRAAGWEVTKAS